MRAFFSSLIPRFIRELRPWGVVRVGDRYFERSKLYRHDSVVSGIFCVKIAHEKFTVVVHTKTPRREKSLQEILYQIETFFRLR